MSRGFVVVWFAVLVGLSGCNAHVEDTRPGQPVKTRQVAFQEILKVFEPMGVMLRTTTMNLTGSRRSRRN
jgi:uncharacterized protein YceK